MIYAHLEGGFAFLVLRVMLLDHLQVLFEDLESLGVLLNAVVFLVLKL